MTSSIIGGILLTNILVMDFKVTLHSLNEKKTNKKSLNVKGILKYICNESSIKVLDKLYTIPLKFREFYTLPLIFETQKIPHPTSTLLHINPSLA